MKFPNRLVIAAFCLLLAARLAYAAPSDFPFTDGTRYTAIGDSITSGGLYHSYVHLFLTTRFPDRKIDFFNAGISGDTASGCLKRMDWDVLPSEPTLTSIMFGMNDVGASNLYASGLSGPEIDEQRRKTIDSCERNIRELVAKLREKNARVILIAPSILDETVHSDATNFPGKNLALGEVAERVKKMAEEQKLTLVDFYTPMVELTQKLQASDPTFSLIGKDRIHPGAPGHLVMAWLYLKALNAPSEVASIVIDKTNASASSNCTVDKISARRNKITFRYKANALPFPIDKGATPALEWIPFIDDFNREMLKVSSLPAGTYRLEIDGTPIRNYTAEELARGVNLAIETSTPQYQQSLEVLDLFKKRWAAIAKLRAIAFVEHGTCRELPRPLSLDEVRPRIEAWVDTAKGKPYEGYFKSCAENYLRDKPHEQEIAAEADRLMQEIRAVAQLRPHEVSLIKSNTP